MCAQLQLGLRVQFGGVTEKHELNGLRNGSLVWMSVVSKMCIFGRVFSVITFIILREQFRG
jgi:hypothetical protein